MDRPIKFRGKRIDNDEWVYGSLLQKYDPTKVENVVMSIFIHDGALSQYQVIVETVGQFTGYKDCNNKEIYFDDYMSNNLGTDKEVMRKVIMYEGNMMMTRVKGKSSLPKYISLHEHYQFNYVVVGNFYEKIKNI